MVYLNWLKRFKIVILAASLIFAAAGLWLARGLDLDPSLASRFLKDNPHLDTYKKFGASFGAEPLLTVVWEGKNDVWEPTSLNRLQELSKVLKQMEGVDSVISTASLPGMDATDASPVDVDRLKQLPLIRKLLVGGEGRRSALLIVPKPDSIAPSVGLTLVKNIEQALNTFIASGERAFVTGPLAMQSKAIEFSRQDLARAVAIVLLIALLVFGFVYRSWQAIACAILVTAAAVGGATGIMALVQVKLSQFALIAIPILAAISLQDAVHLLEHFVAARRHGADTVKACRHMFASAGIPCAWTTATTMVGFGALLISDIEQIRSIGLVVIVGAPLALLASLIAVPALLMAAPMAARAQEGSKNRSAAFVSILSRRAPWLAVGIFVITLITAYGLRYARVSLDFPHLFRPSVPFQQQFAEVDSKLHGGASFEIVMEATDGGDFTQQEKLELVRSLQLALSLTAPIDVTVSPIDVGLTAYLLKHGMPEQPASLWKNAGQLVHAMRDEQSSPLAGWLSPDLKTARVHARVRTDKQKHHDRLLRTLAYLRNGFAKRGVLISWSGLALLYKEMERRMVRELITSFAIAFVGVLIFMMLLFRSVKWGLLSMIPNVLPIAVTVGIMGWAGVGFSLGLIILPAVGLGLVVDDTIHMVWGVRRQLRGGHDVRESVTRILSTTGRALILSTLILASGFASLWASPFISNTQLAIFMPLLLILALMFDLVAVPVVLILAQRRRDRARPPHSPLAQT